MKSANTPSAHARTSLEASDVADQAINMPEGYQALPGGHVSKVGSARFSRLTTVPKGQILYYEGQAPTRVYLLSSGKIKISVSTSEGRLVLVRIVEPGEMFGLSAALTGMEHRSTAQTLEASEVASMPKKAFVDEQSKDPAAFSKITRQISSNYRSALKLISLLSSRDPVRVRLARLFITWVPSRYRDGNTVTLRHSFTHEQIGEMIGTTRETVTRCLSELSQENLVTLNRGRVFVHDIDGLRCVASARRGTGAPSL